MGIRIQQIGSVTGYSGCSSVDFDAQVVLGYNVNGKKVLQQFNIGMLANLIQ